MMLISHKTLFEKGDIVYFPCRTQNYIDIKNDIEYGIVLDAFLIRNKVQYSVYSYGIFEIEEENLHLVETNNNEKEFIVKHFITNDKEIQKMAMEGLK